MKTKRIQCMICGNWMENDLILVFLNRNLGNKSNKIILKHRRMVYIKRVLPFGYCIYIREYLFQIVCMYVHRRYWWKVWWFELTIQQLKKNTQKLLWNDLIFHYEIGSFATHTIIMFQLRIKRDTRNI